MVAKELNTLLKISYACLVVDEGHRLKNKEGRLFQDLKQLNVQHKILLTGTPLQNHLGELFMLMHFLEPAKFDSEEAFQAEFSNISHEEQVNSYLGKLPGESSRVTPPLESFLVSLLLAEAFVP